MANSKIIKPGTPTQVAHPGQAIKRTLSTVIAGLTLVLGVLALITEVFGVYLGDNIVAWVAGASAFLTATILFLTRLQSLESLQAFWIKLGLGTGVEKEDAPAAPAAPAVNEGYNHVGLEEPADIPVGSGRHRATEGF